MKQPILYSRVMKNKLVYEPIVLFVVVLCVAFGGWKFERWLNYKISYSSQVTEQVQPIVDRIVVLEKRVNALEKK